MRVVRCVFVVCLALATLAGCANPMKEVKRLLEPSGEALLQQGIRNYEKGRLPQASEYFQEALDAGLPEADQVTAHKHLAFIDCASKRERQCRAHFRIALEINPAFDLEPAEAANPAWGPIFRALKARHDRSTGKR